VSLFDEWEARWGIKPGWSHVGDGWVPLLEKLCTDLKATGFKEFDQVAQVKEKFGTLRVYFDCGLEPEQWVLVEAAERKSATICEDCGAPGEPRHGGWIRTLCSIHAALAPAPASCTEQFEATKPDNSAPAEPEEKP
jgi:hypothetical protein